MNEVETCLMFRECEKIALGLGFVINIYPDGCKYEVFEESSKKSIKFSDLNRIAAFLIGFDAGKNGRI